MGDVVNLRQARKRRAREAARAAGDAAAARHGRSAAERHADEDAKAKADAHLDGHRRRDTQPLGREVDDPAAPSTDEGAER